MTYMTSCGSTSCDQFDPTGAKWFKIDQLGLKQDGSTWYQADISSTFDRVAYLSSNLDFFSGSGDSFDVTLPQNLSPGGYLIRHEIIALHLAVSIGGAEFYPMCTQVMIGGSGNGTPNPTVSFPGAYSDTDPGIYDPDVSDTLRSALFQPDISVKIFNPGSNYTFPGGPVANLAGTDASMAAPYTGPTVFPSGTAASALPAPSGQPAASPTSEASGPGSTPAGDPAPTGAASSGPGGSSSTCSLKARAGPGANQKRHFRRFLRRALSYASH
jgi:hypothetical protein